MIKPNTHVTVSGVLEMVSLRWA